MAGNRNAQIALLLAAVESTEGTDAAPVVASNAIQIVDSLAAHGEFAFKHNRPKLITGAINSSPPLAPKGLKGSWQNHVHLRGTRNGLAYSASNLPEIDPFFQSAGFSQTLVTTAGFETVTYKPATTGLKSHTEYYYADGRLKKMLGAKSDVDFSLDAGGPMIVALKRIGLYQIPTDAAVPTVVSTTFGTVVPPTADNLGLTITPSGAAAYSTGIIRKFGLNLGTHISQRANANAVGALSPDRVRMRDPKFSITLEDELAATIDWETIRQNSGQTTGGACSLAFTLGGTQYNKCTFTLPNIRIEDVKIEDDNGTILTTISGGAYDSVFAANDCVQIQYL